ncbi:hypothetical protein D3C72_2345070 [compost metagenome]
MAIDRTVTRYVQRGQLIYGKVWVITKHAGRVALRIVIDDQHSEPSQRKVDTKVYRRSSLCRPAFLHKS